MGINSGRFAGDMPTITIVKMAKMLFVPDLPYAHEPDVSYKPHHRLREDVSREEQFFSFRPSYIYFSVATVFHPSSASFYTSCFSDNQEKY